MLASEVSRRRLLTRAFALPVMVGATSVGLTGSAEAYPWSRTLRRGSSGADVVELQIRVAGWAANSPQQTCVAIDGAFGPGTQAAVRRFQLACGVV